MIATMYTPMCTHLHQAGAPAKHSRAVPWPASGPRHTTITKKKLLSARLARLSSYQFNTYYLDNLNNLDDLAWLSELGSVAHQAQALCRLGCHRLTKRQATPSAAARLGQPSTPSGGRGPCVLLARLVAALLHVAAHFLHGRQKIPKLARLLFELVVHLAHLVFHHVGHARI